MSERPVGKPYSQVYMERGAATQDSARFRNRLRGYLRELPDGYLSDIASRISKETGAAVYFGNMATHITECSLPDLLDNITHIIEALRSIQTRRGMHLPWIEFVARSLKEENLAYVVDLRGGMHPAHDEEFDASRRATIAALGLPRYATARRFFEESMSDLLPPEDTRDAVRKVFEAVENVAKLMVPIARLGPTEVQKSLKPLATRGLSGAELEATKLMLNEFADWVNACQQYRHAPGTEEPDPPSADLAIWMISSGAAHLRWLIKVDQNHVGE